MKHGYLTFELKTPNPPTWNGSWSGEGRKFILVRNLSQDQCDKILSKDSYRYAFSDGWTVFVYVKQVDGAAVRKIKKQSAGFDGYDWMVDSIIKEGAIFPASLRIKVDYNA